MWVSGQGGKEGRSGRAGAGAAYRIRLRVFPDPQAAAEAPHHRGYLSSSVTAYSTLSPSLTLCVLPDPDPMYNSLLACPLAPSLLASSFALASSEWGTHCLYLPFWKDGWMIWRRRQDTILE